MTILVVQHLRRPNTDTMSQVIRLLPSPLGIIVLMSLSPQYLYNSFSFSFSYSCSFKYFTS